MNPAPSLTPSSERARSSSKLRGLRFGSALSRAGINIRQPLRKAAPASIAPPMIQPPPRRKFAPTRAITSASHWLGVIVFALPDNISQARIAPPKMSNGNIDQATSLGCAKAVSSLTGGCWEVCGSARCLISSRNSWRAAKWLVASRPRCFLSSIVSPEGKSSR